MSRFESSGLNIPRCAAPSQIWVQRMEEISSPLFRVVSTFERFDLTAWIEGVKSDVRRIAYGVREEEKVHITNANL